MMRGYEARSSPARWSRPRNVFAHALVRASALSLTIDRAVEHRLLLAVRLEPLVGLRPDALRVVDLAQALAGAAARPVALVLRALRLRADVGDLGQRAVAAVAAAEERHLGRLLQPRGRPSRRPAPSRPPGRTRVRPGRAARRARTRAAWSRRLKRYLSGHPQLGLPPALRLEVRRVHLVRRELRLRVGLEEVELVGERIVDLRRELPPVVLREASRPGRGSRRRSDAGMWPPR